MKNIEVCYKPITNRISTPSDCPHGSKRVECRRRPKPNAEPENVSKSQMAE